MVTIYEVAQQAKVSPGTVSRVFNGSASVAPATRERVLKVAQALSYIPMAAARTLRLKETHNVGLILPSITNPVSIPIVTAIEDALYRRGYRITLCNAEENTERELMHLHALKGGRMDGLIVSSSGVDPREYLEFQQLGMPIIAVDRELSGVTTDAVVMDNFSGSYEATQYLMELGHERIAVVTLETHVSTPRERLGGYFQALRDRGLPEEPNLVRRCDRSPAANERMVREILTGTARPTSLIAMNYPATLAALKVIRQLGLQIPQDLSLIGYGESDWNVLVEPPLTVVNSVAERLGREAVELLIHRLKHPEAPLRKVVLPVRLIVRGSCAPPRAQV